MRRNTALLFFLLLLVAGVPPSSQLSSGGGDGGGGRARAAHAAANAVAGAAPITITARQTAAAAAMQGMLEDAYDGVDYIAALDAADTAPPPPFDLDLDEATTYGEFPLTFLLALLDRFAPENSSANTGAGGTGGAGVGRFLDLGSGRGQVVLAAAKHRRWASCRGVEVMPELHFIAADAGRRWTTAPSEEGRENIAGASPVEFTLGDIYNPDDVFGSGGGAGGGCDLSADLVFCYATCLDVDEEGSLSRLAACLEGHLKDGATVITINRPLLPVRDDNNKADDDESRRPFQLLEILMGPNPEAEADSLLSAAYVWRKEAKGE
jgi:SAM-dependent methyltransferase